MKSTTTTNPDTAFEHVSNPDELLTQIRDHDQVERVVSYDDDSRFDGTMVILDWVTDATMENGTRIIHEKNYDGHIRNVAAFLDNLEGITRTGANKTGIAEYTFHIEFTD